MEPPEVPAGTETFFLASSMYGHEYLPNGFIERLIASVMEFATPYLDYDPSVSLDFPHPAEVEEKGKILVKVKIQDSSKQAIVILSSNGKNIVCSVQALGGDGDDSWVLHANNVVELATEVNDEFFRGRLKLVPSRKELVGDVNVMRGGGRNPMLEGVRLSPEDSEKETEKEEQDQNISTSNMLSFLRDSCGIKEAKAQKYIDFLSDEDVETAEDLVDYLADGEGDFEDLLEEAGCSKMHIKKIKKNVEAKKIEIEEKKESEKEREKSEKEKKPYVLVITAGEDLNTSDETKQINKAFAGDKKRKAVLLKENNVAAMTEMLRQNNEIECVHFALHGAVSSTGKNTLAMRTSRENEDMRDPNEVGNVIRTSQASVKSIILNICQGANSAKDFIGDEDHGAEYVIGWTTDVVDSAAVQFSEQYYASIKDGLDIMFAYFHAITVMRDIYDWQVDMNPSNQVDRKRLQERRKSIKRSTLKIAGVPALYRRTEGGGLEEVKKCPRKTREKIELVRQLSRGSTKKHLLDVKAALTELKYGQDRISDQSKEIKEAVKDAEKKILSAVDQSMHAVMNAMFEIDEYDVPRSFIILPYELGAEGAVKGGKSILVISGSSLDKAQSWMEKLTSVISVVSSDVAKARKDAALRVKEIFETLKSEKLYLYLVDEVTGDPVMGPNYPVVIESASENTKRFLPLMTVGLKALSAANSAAGLVRCFGIPAPKLTQEVMQTATGFVDAIASKSSAERYDILQSVIDSDFGGNFVGAEDGKKRKLRGAALREFKRFLEENDANKKFAGLERMMGSDGHVVWTIRDESGEGGEMIRSINPPVPHHEVLVGSSSKEEEEETKIPATPPAAPSSTALPLTGWLTKFPPRASESSSSAGKKMKRQLLCSFGLAKKQKRYCMLTSNEMLYYVDETKRELKGVIEGVDKLMDLKVKGNKLSFVCGGRMWEFEGEVGVWGESLKRLGVGLVEYNEGLEGRSVRTGGKEGGREAGGNGEGGY